MRSQRRRSSIRGGPFFCGPETRGKFESDLDRYYYSTTDVTAVVACFSMEIALNGSFFNTHRMMEQRALKAYFRQGGFLS